MLAVYVIYILLSFQWFKNLMVSCLHRCFLFAIRKRRTWNEEAEVSTIKLRFWLFASPFFSTVSPFSYLLIAKSWLILVSKGAFTLDEKQRKAKVTNLREWSLRSIAQNKPTIQQQFCLREVKQPLAGFTTGWNLPRYVDMTVALRRFALLRFQRKRTFTIKLRRIRENQRVRHVSDVFRWRTNSLVDTVLMQFAYIFFLGRD